MRRLLPFSILPARNPDDPHRAATQLELFFDLISVIAIAAITAGLHHAISEGHGLDKLPVFIFLFTAIWWAWMNFTWFASAFDNDGPTYRLLVMFIMGGELIFAGGAEHIFKTLDLGWGVLGWTIMRLAMAM
jgi:low temperature requirement protein LtrA